MAHWVPTHKTCGKGFFPGLYLTFYFAAVLYTENAFFVYGVGIVLPVL